VKKFFKKLRVLLVSAGLVVMALILFWGLQANQASAQIGGQMTLPGNKIAQFVDPLPDLHTIIAGTGQIVLNMSEFQSMVMPSTFVPAAGTYTGTWVWGYLEQGQTAIPSYIGPVIVSTRGTPTEIKYVNNLGTTATSNLLAWTTSTDQTLHWADPKGEMGALTNYAGPIPAVPHLHGGEVPPQLDGGPDAWFLSQPGTGYKMHGHAYYSFDDPYNTGNANYAIYRYPNTQEAANIWFHDHALGITRLNVYAGLAGAYIIQDTGAGIPTNLPDLIPMVIQDRMFDTNGQLFFPNLGINPEHPFWLPEFVGDTIVVNGKVWPFKDVDRKRYRLLFLNGSNARFYDMFFIDPVSGIKGPPMYVISTDGGYLNNPVLIDPNATGKGGPKSLVVAPGERYEVIVDFNDPAWIANLESFYGVGLVPNPLPVQLRNNARTPFPDGEPARKNTTGRIIEFRVFNNAPVDGSFDPSTLGALRNPMVRLVDPVLGAPGAGVTPVVTRQLTLNEVMGPGGPLEVLVNNTKWSGTPRSDFTPVENSDGTFTYYSELPNEGDTELWEIINLTADAHPIHLHLVQFQLMNRQPFDIKGYTAAYDMAFGGVFVPAIGPPLDYNIGAGTHPVYGTLILGGNPDVTAFLNPKRGPALPPLAHEAGWKDTVIVYPGEVTRIMVRWAPTDVSVGDTANEHFPFDPNGGHGYVWHCHIIDHEDNEMMRPDQVISLLSAVRTLLMTVDY
jgi:FtsP/CotA-like multicopper oxidase with cupredoxin domain